MITEPMALTTVQQAIVPVDTPQQEATRLLAVIANAVANPACDVDKMERLLAMQQAVMKQQREAAFMAALSRLQAKLPQIERHGEIIVKGQLRSRYAKAEDIDAVIRPMLNEEGFAFSFDSEPLVDGKAIRLSCKLSHKDGHSETKYLLLPIDASDYRSSVQNVGSTVSYGRRQLIKMHLNIIERDEDTDGNEVAFITEKQVLDLDALISELKANKDGFLSFMGVKKLEEISARDYQKAVNALEVKRRARA